MQTSNTCLFAGLEFTAEELFILKCLRLKFCDEKNEPVLMEPIPSLNWQALYERSMQFGVAPLMYKIINDHSSLLQHADMSNDFLQKLKSVYLRTYIINSESFRCFVDVLSVFNEAGIKVILLKGSHLAQFIYKDIGVRPMADIDIMVEKKELGKVEELLGRIGYSYIDMEKVYEDYRINRRHTQGQSMPIEHYKTDYHHLHPFSNPTGLRCFEVHWSIVPFAAPLCIDIEGLWDRSISKKLNGRDVLVFSPEDSLLHLCLHLSRMDEFRKHGLRQLCDIAEIVYHHGQNLNWDSLRGRAITWKAEKYFYIALRLSQEILGATVPDEFLRDLKPLPFNEKIILEAKKRVLSLEAKPPKGMAHSAKIVRFDAAAPLYKKLAFFLKRIIIPPEKLALRYSLPASSKRIPLYYLVRLASLFYNYVHAYSRYFLYRLFHKKEEHNGYNLDLWLNLSGSKPVRE